MVVENTLYTSGSQNDSYITPGDHVTAEGAHAKWKFIWVLWKLYYKIQFYDPFLFLVKVKINSNKQNGTNIFLAIHFRWIFAFLLPILKGFLLQP